MRIDGVSYADEGDWSVRLLGPRDYRHRGWMWSDAHDGDGKSLELINPALGNDYGQNFSATDSNEGTPGELNTVYSDDVAPLILEVEHYPIIPGPNDPVFVTARIIDEQQAGVSVMLHYRIDTSSYENGEENIYPRHDPNDYNGLTMFDDGAHGDGGADDGVYGVQIPSHPDRTIVEFYVEASDTSANSRTWPAPSMIGNAPEQVTNALYLVDESFDPDTWTAGSQPIYYLIMTENEKGRLFDIGDGSGSEHNSDAQMNATFVSVDGVDIKVRCNVGIRNRGHGSRNNPPNNYRVNFPHDRPWKGVTAINLNTKYTFVQLAGSAIFRISGLALPEATAVQIRVNGEDLAETDPPRMFGSYVHLEVVDTDFADNHFPDDNGGNAYKCMRDDGPADFSYHGPDPNFYRPSYFKRTNTAEDDWSKLIELCYILDRAPDSNYVQEVRRVINVEQWIRFFALNALLDNNETSLANGYGDDYYLYQGILDPRFVLIQHDLDSILGYNGSSATRGIFRSTGLPTIDRFITHPEFIHRYYFHLKDLIETTFSAERIGPLLDELLGDFVPAGIIAQMKNFVEQRNAHVLSLIPSEFTIQSDLQIVDNYRHTIFNTFALSGSADVTETRSVLVNGQLAEWSPVAGTWEFGGAGGVTETIVESGSVWKFLDNGSNQRTLADGMNWFGHPNYNDSFWLEGPAELGYGDAGQGRPESTVVNSGPAGNFYITTYFRHYFVVDDASRYTNLHLGLMCDDAAVVYLNGVEVARSNLPEGQINYLTTANTNIAGNDEYTFLDFGVDARLIHNGTNVLAVEIHQFSPASVDISFDLLLDGILPAPGAGELQPGINRVIVQTFDGPMGSGNELERDYIDIWYDTGQTNDYPKENNGSVPSVMNDITPNLIVRDSYLPGTQVLVRVEALNGDGTVNRNLWDAVATLSVWDNPSINLSTNLVTLYNGLGSALVSFTGSGDFTLTVNINGLETNKVLIDWSDQPVNVASGSLGSSETWSGIYHITGGDFTILDGVTLTLNPGTLVLIDGVSSGSNGTDIDVAGSIQSLGTASSPVTFTAYTAGENWGEFHHIDAESSTFQYTNITQAGHSPRIGHSNSGPTIRASNSTFVFEYCSLTDNAGKIGHVTSGCDLTFRNCLFARSIMGPEISGTALLFENSWITDMHSDDDADGIYIHGQQAGQLCTLFHGVAANVDDDGIDTLRSEVTIEDLIVRDCKDKGISIYGGEVDINNCLIVENNKAPEDPTIATIATKTVNGNTAVVNIDHTTIVTTKTTGYTDVGIQSHNKYGVTSGTIIYNVTNSIIDATNPIDVQSPYLESDIHIDYSNLFWEPWPGTGNISSDPIFVDQANHNYRLQENSPCIDAGDPGADPDPDLSITDQGYSWFDQNSPELPEGSLIEDTVWAAQEGPYSITGELVVPAGISLTILPGTSVFFYPDAQITIHGQLIAEGTEYELIRFTRTPLAIGTWNGIQFVNTMNDNRITYAVIEYGRTNDGMIGLENSNLLLDHVTLDNTDLRRISTIDSSLIVSNSMFTDIFAPGQPPTTDNRSEHIWGRGIPEGCQFIIENNIFGTTKGHNDAIDFDGPSRPNPIAQILNNVFMGGGDDALDLQADAHIEGNVFMDYRKDQYNKASGESNVISAGGGKHYVMTRNVFYNVQHIAQVKDDAFLTFVNNTISNTSGAAIYFDLGLPGRDPGRGAYVDGNIFWKAPLVFEGVIGSTDLTVNCSIIPAEWHYLGIGNVDADPLFVNDQSDFHLKSMSPAIGTGSCGLDMGAYVPSGVAIYGEPDELTYRTDAVLTVGGPGITHYKYRINNGPWSAEQSIDMPIHLTNLINGQFYTVYVIGKNSAGLWQSQDNPTFSRTWTIDTSYSRLVINEVLAHTHGADPDLIELYYDGPGSLDLSDMSLTDDPRDTRKFVFSNGTVSRTIMNPGDYLLLYGDLNTQLKDHLGFALYSEGEGLYLYDKPANGGGLIDSVEFGPQINSYSIGRIGYGGMWKLNKPSFGHANIAQPLGDPETLKINEWLANSEVLFENDFIELFNPHAFPVDLSSLYLTDNPITQPDKHLLGPLSFIAGKNFAIFIADGQNLPGHVDFRLSADGEMIGLFDTDLNEIDKVLYGPQTTDVSLGRIPDGNDSFEFFELPTPGVANPSDGIATVIVTSLMPESADKRVLVPTGDIGQAWRNNLNFDDSTWSLCTGSPGGVGYERTSGYEDLISLDVEAQMYSENTTCYIRIPFTVEADELAKLTELTLKVRYDDGFIAYLNGVEVEKQNFDGIPTWNSRASSGHSDPEAVAFEYFIITDFISDLKPDENILAIQGLNGSSAGADMLISAELDGTITTPAEEFPLVHFLELLDGLRVTELMYHAADGSNFDYIELQNISQTALDVNGIRFSEGIEFTFPDMTLEAGQYVMVVSNLAAFRSAYGTDIKVAGEYSGNLNNGGEGIVLILPWPLEAAIMRFEYSDRWYPTTDGGGNALVIYEPLAHPATWRQPESWYPATPTPGRP
ncbi:MAG: lamin tail domain-containing protein [Planctomycetota bacterium]